MNGNTRIVRGPAASVSAGWEWMLEGANMDSKSIGSGILKTTVDIPEKELEDAIRFTKAKTKREAVVAAIVDFNRRRRMAELIRHAGTCDELMTVEELQRQRRRG